MTKESKRGKFPERWTDDEGYERDPDGNLILDPDEAWEANYALDRAGRGAALEFWQRIANEERNGKIDTFIWLVANRLIEADRNKGDVRRDAIVRAVGLAGQGQVDPVLRTQKRKNTKARDDRIEELISLKLPERDIWRKLAEEGLFRPAPAEGRKEAIPSKLRGAIQKARKAMQERERQMIRGFENLDGKS